MTLPGPTDIPKTSVELWLGFVASAYREHTPPSLKQHGNREKIVRMIADWIATPAGEPLIIGDGLAADDGAFIAKAAILFPGG